MWVGSGLAGVDGLNAGDAVTAEQMRALYGAGMHPLATQRLEQLRDADLTDANIEAATRLGVPFKISASEPGRFRVEVAKRMAASNKQAGLSTDWPVSSTERARIRSAVAQELFAAQIERAHHAAVHDALRFLEQHALYTREGPQGIRQVNVRGLVAAAFTHRDSRAGDPDLPTHVAVANKVQTLGGRWLSIDGRVLFKVTVAASETYNTALEHHLRDRLGVRFADRPDTDPRKQPVREIVGVDPALNQRWSTRRLLIKDRQRELANKFQRDHDRPPTPIEALQLAPAGHLGDPRRQARTPHPDRAARRLAHPGRGNARRISSGPDHDQRGPQSDLNHEPARRCGVGGSDSGEGIAGGGGAAFDLAELACPRRSTTPRTSRRNRNRQVRSAD